MELWFSNLENVHGFNLIKIAIIIRTNCRKKIILNSYMNFKDCT